MASLLSRTTATAFALATAVQAQAGTQTRVHPRIQAELNNADSYERVTKDEPQVKLQSYLYDLDYCQTFFRLTDLTAA